MAFDSLYTHGFARVAAAVPHLRPAEPAFNVERTLGLAARASDERAALVVFPELGLSAYAIDDYFQQDALTDGVLDAVRRVVEASRELLPVLVVGGPLRAEHGVFNAGVRDPPRARARRRAQELPPELPRVLRGAPVPRRPRGRSATASSCWGRRSRSARTSSSAPPTVPAWPCTSRSARTSGCRSRRAPTARWPGATVLANLSREQHHGRQGRLPAHAVHGAVRAHDRGLHLHRRRRAASRRPTSPGTARR